MAELPCCDCLTRSTSDYRYLAHISSTGPCKAYIPSSGPCKIFTAAISAGFFCSSPTFQSIDGDIHSSGSFCPASVSYAECNCPVQLCIKGLSACMFCVCELNKPYCQLFQKGACCACISPCCPVR